MLDAVYGFVDAGDQGLAIRVEFGIAGREVAVDDLTVDEAALKISGNQIHTAHSATFARGVGEERAR